MSTPWVERNEPAEWNARVSPETPDYVIADTGSEGSHRLRLEAVARLPFAKGDTVLELGCGTGALADVLPPSVIYTGLDFSQDVVVEARRRRPGLSFLLGGTESLSESDWIIANGPFSYSRGWSREQTRSTVQQMWSLAVRGIAATFLRTFTTDAPRLKYTETEVVEWTDGWDASRIDIDRSYLPNDFCLRAWKAVAAQQGP